MTQYRFTITGGAYTGVTWTGQIADVPATIIVPEGIVSAREPGGRQDAWARCDEPEVGPDR